MVSDIANEVSFSRGHLYAECAPPLKWIHGEEYPDNTMVATLMHFRFGTKILSNPNYNAPFLNFSPVSRGQDNFHVHTFLP